jgi:hypothetical protein
MTETGGRPPDPSSLRELLPNANGVAAHPPPGGPGHRQAGRAAADALRGHAPRHRRHHSDEPLELLINNKVIGVGETVKVGENFGLRITQIGDLKQVIKSLGSEQR